MNGQSDRVAAAGEPVWHGPGAGRLRLEPLDTLTIAYDRTSGQTHLLAPPLPELLDLLAAGPATGAALVARMAEQFDLGDQDVPSLVAERLAELTAMGLVERR
ncbi:HPr-rel-A system PqqD family peptide chaperone [Sphingomonas lacunae]|uniref:HPr-rel-A system PqqD family peptide chaperone n=1 Tax=Sphingomonas lacunae TaxID=2698828 RepID=A0A6M4AUX1_9SPHN|nr:HPr-rel-A system PqqD family peptide chaperone [Sphingomonas lacunae]QJQ32496.1 HPr-rel-A system PqqD family peptide chaperone [Sphingomonas lacunae]